MNTTTDILRLLLPLSFVLAAGCDLGPKVVGEDTTPSAESESASMSGADSSDSDSMTGDDSDSGQPTPDAGDGSGDSCDPLVQDCVEGEGCYPAGDVFECGDTSPNPQQPGDACNQHTDCNPGLVCGDDSECVQICDTNGADCPDPAQSCVPAYPDGAAPPGYEDVGYCSGETGPTGDACNPLVQGCVEGEGCYPSGDGFACGDADSGQAGDACAQQGDCDVGLFCGDDSECVEYCDTDTGLCNDPGLSCEPYYAPGQSPPGLENVGFCGGETQPGDACDPLVQDCPDGDGCYPFGDGFACQDVNDPAQAGDACAVDADCGPGLTCTEEAECTPFCDLNNDECDAPDQTCIPWWPQGQAAPGYEDVGYCAEEAPAGDTCDPLAQDCPAGDGCYPASGMVFTCRDTAAAAGSAGDACPSHTDCAPGLFCSDANECVTVCDTNGADCDDPQFSCIQLYADGASPPGLEDVGYCG